MKVIIVYSALILSVNIYFVVLCGGLSRHINTYKNIFQLPYHVTIMYIKESFNLHITPHH